MSNLDAYNPEQTPQSSPNWGIAGEAAKYTTIIAVVGVAFYILRKKLTHLEVTWDQFWNTFYNIPRYMIVGALIVTALNYIVLAGYDWIAVRYLKKTVSLEKILTGAIIGYAFSNVLGWILGGSPVRFMLYSRWGFRFVEVVAFISVLTVTFWLGMFLISGIAFVLLPVQLPEVVQDALGLDPKWYGYLFLSMVLLYLLATIFVRKPIHIGRQEFKFPPFRLSLLQLAVSASDFALASLVLYLLLPHNGVNYPTVMVAYLAAMIVVVVTHVPGGAGVLELVLLEMLSQSKDAGVPVLVGIILFRIIYYFVPFIIAICLFIVHEIRWKAKKVKRATQSESPTIENPSS